MTEFSAADKLACVERELRFRRVVYQRRVDRKTMEPVQRDWELGCMEAIASDYRAEVKGALVNAAP